MALKKDGPYNPTDGNLSRQMLGEFECDMPNCVTQRNSKTGIIEIQTNSDQSLNSLNENSPDAEFYIGKRRWFELPLFNNKVGTVRSMVLVKI